MLGIVLGTADIGHLKQTFVSIPLHLIALVMVGYTVSPLLNCYRWLLFARAGGVRAPICKRCARTFSAPSSTASDWGLLAGISLAVSFSLQEGRSRRKPLPQSRRTVSMGLAVLALVGSFAALFLNHQHVPNWLLRLLAAVGPGIILCWFMMPWVVVRLFPKGGGRLQRKFVRIASVFPKEISMLLFVTGLSILFHLFQIGLHRLMGYGVGVTIPFATLLFVVPFVNIVSSLPISWQGLGVRETAYIFFLYPHVLTREQAVAFGLIWLLALTCVSAVGAILAALAPSHLDQLQRSREMKPKENRIPGRTDDGEDPRESQEPQVKSSHREAFRKAPPAES